MTDQDRIALQRRRLWDREQPDCPRSLDYAGAAAGRRRPRCAP